MRRYGELYSLIRLETLDSLDRLPELVNSEELKNKLLFSVVVVSEKERNAPYRSSRYAQRFVNVCFSWRSDPSRPLCRRSGSRCGGSCSCRRPRRPPPRRPPRRRERRRRWRPPRWPRKRRRRGRRPGTSRRPSRTT